MTAALIDTFEFVATNDLSAPDAIGIGQDDIDRFDFRMRIKKCVGLGEC